MRARTSQGGDYTSTPTGYAAVDRLQLSGAASSENSDTREPGEEKGTGRERQVKLLGARVACAIGILFGVGSALASVVGGAPNTSGGALGAALSILGFLLGARRLATAAVVFCVASIFFALAASQGLIPGIESLDRSPPGVQTSVND